MILHSWQPHAQGVEPSKAGVEPSTAGVEPGVLGGEPPRIGGESSQPGSQAPRLGSRALQGRSGTPRPKSRSLPALVRHAAAASPRLNVGTALIPQARPDCLHSEQLLLPIVVRCLLDWR